jgi:hypothetical protein
MAILWHSMLTLLNEDYILEHTKSMKYEKDIDGHVVKRWVNSGLRFKLRKELYHEGMNDE